MLKDLKVNILGIVFLSTEFRDIRIGFFLLLKKRAGSDTGFLTSRVTNSKLRESDKSYTPSSEKRTHACIW